MNIMIIMGLVWSAIAVIASYTDQETLIVLIHILGANLWFAAHEIVKRLGK